MALTVLFILAACVPIPEGLGQAATNTLELTEKTSPWLTFPAPVPTEQGEKVEIFSADYPTSPDNFILTDPRTNEEKTELIKSWAPDDYEKEVSLYKAEIERMGQRAEDFGFEASIVDGKSWVVIPRNKKTGRMYVPKVAGIIQSSLHLWGQLDRSDDFFDLVEVGIDNPKLLGDKSVWHVFAKVMNFPPLNGLVTQWYDAVNDNINNVEIEPTPTPETNYVINANFPIISLPELSNNYDRIASKFSVISWEDISSRELFEYEQEYMLVSNI